VCFCERSAMTGLDGVTAKQMHHGVRHDNGRLAFWIDDGFVLFAPMDAGLLPAPLTRRQQADFRPCHAAPHVSGDPLEIRATLLQEGH